MLHAASLVDSKTHSRDLIQLVGMELSKPMIEYVVECVETTVEHAMQRSLSLKNKRTADFADLVSKVLARAEVGMLTLLVAIVYVCRARAHLQIAFEQWALERVFLGALIVASKYLNDSTLKNVHWALCTEIFGKSEIGLVEREFLEVLDFRLGVKENDLLAHHAMITGKLSEPGHDGRGIKRERERTVQTKSSKRCRAS
ncbi:hypothetical protein B0H14DRAFT_2512680 [Mycena olivaceomarginata]|nr:hypothetical protein B0H14DRAFT_2512680 [Mycena olivaceomarginata]